MKKSDLLILHIWFNFGEFSISLLSNRLPPGINLWYATPYPKNDICPPKGNTINFPTLKDFAGANSCYQHLDEVRQQITSFQHTVPAIKARKFNLVTYHNVTTKDGYLLTVFRITGHENEEIRPGKPVVLLAHPMLVSSDVWFFLPGNKSIVNKLVNAGYEVWMPNVRGTRYSQGHLTLNAYTDIAYWDFSMHEVGVYDLPAVINLMLDETGNQKIFYVGYSLSTNTDAIARAEIPELNDKFHTSFWMGASIHLGHLPSQLRTYIYLLGNGGSSEFLKEVLNVMTGGHVGLLDVDDNQRFIGFRICTLTPTACALCGNIVSSFVGYDGLEMNHSDVARIFWILSAVSFKSYIHLGENIRFCRFQKYNYGPEQNYKLYGQPYPPLYNLSNVRSPVYMFYGEGDNIAVPLDQRITRDALPPGTVKGYFRVQWKPFNHFGFIYARNADTLVYDRIVNIMDTYTYKTKIAV